MPTNNLPAEAIDPVRLRSIVPLRKPKRKLRHAPPSSAEEITSLSVDTLRRRYPHLIRDISDRRSGMLLRDALAIASGEVSTKVA
jgi:hypothetical protein